MTLIQEVVLPPTSKKSTSIPILPSRAAKFDVPTPCGTSEVDIYPLTNYTFGRVGFALLNLLKFSKNKFTNFQLKNHRKKNKRAPVR